MAQTTTTAADPGVVVAPIPGWAVVALLAVAALALWLVTFDNGQLGSVLARGDLFLHEFFHDGRHLIGVPCH
ncbi:MAG TPA: CbtB-domain containing protein [Acidimicrobiales bacterium]|jgi:Probable cobalt transporter subunit (CbtB)|nr:CbtB-domain containing protein [Acidimicrobiales bacterium]